MLMLCKNALQLARLNAFVASTSKTASVCLSWKVLISPTPIGRSPWFLSKGIIPHAMKSSKEDPSSFSKHSYLVKDAIAPQRSAELPPNQFEANILRQPSASSPDGLNLKLIFYASHQHLAPLVLIAALRTSSAVISSYLIG